MAVNPPRLTKESCTSSCLETTTCYSQSESRSGRAERWIKGQSKCLDEMKASAAWFVPVPRRNRNPASSVCEINPHPGRVQQWKTLSQSCQRLEETCCMLDPADRAQRFLCQIDQGHSSKGKFFLLWISKCLISASLFHSLSFSNTIEVGRSTDPLKCNLLSARQRVGMFVWCGGSP